MKPKNIGWQERLKIKFKKSSSKINFNAFKEEPEVKTIKENLKKKLSSKKTKTNESQTYRKSEKVRKLRESWENWELQKIMAKTKYLEIETEKNIVKTLLA